MAIQMFRPQYRAIQNPINLDVLANTYNTLEKGHQAAVAQTAAYKQALNELDLNEAEDAWVVQRQQQIQDAFNNNLVYGNAAAAVDDIVKTYGDIAGDPGMKGRLRAQNDYKTYLANLESNNTLDEDAKEYFREKNKYYYQDKYDSAGNVIGGTKWNPVEREVDHIPLNIIFNQARQWAAKESGSGNSVMFLDANGKPTDDYSKSVTGEIYKQVGTTWEKLGEDKLRAAIDAAIKSIPGAQASLDQEYNVAVWKHQKGEPSGVVDNNGVTMTRSQYLENKINPFIKSTTYFNQQNVVKYGDAWKSQLAYRQKQVGNTVATNNESLKGLTNITSYPVRIKNTNPVEAQASITANRQKLSDIFKFSNPNLKIDLHNAKSEEIENAIANIEDPNLKIQAAMYAWNIKNDQDYINTIKEGHGENGEKFEAYNAIMSMSDLNNNTHYNEYTSLIDEFIGGADAVRQYVSDSELQRFKEVVGAQNIINSGIILGHDEKGNNYIQLNHDNYKAGYTFASGIKDSEDGFWKSLFGGRNKNKLVLVKDGSEVPLSGYADIASGNPQSNRNHLNEIVSMVDSYNRASDIVLNGGEIVTSNIAIGSLTPQIAAYDMYINNGVDVEKYKSMKKNATDNILNNILPHVSLTQTSGYILDEETQTFRRMTSEEAKDGSSILRMLKPNDVSAVITPDPITGDACVQITAFGRTSDGNKVSAGTYILGSNALSDSDKEAWDRNSTWIASKQLKKYSDGNRPLNITSNMAYANIPTIAYEFEDNLVAVKSNGNITYATDLQNMVDLYEPIVALNQYIELLKYGPQPVEVVQPMAERAANAIAIMNGLDSSYTLYYTDIIMKNLGY